MHILLLGGLPAALFFGTITTGDAHGEMLLSIIPVVPKFLFLSAPSRNVLKVGCMVKMLWEGDFQCQFLSQLALSFLCHRCFSR